MNTYFTCDHCTVQCDQLISTYCQTCDTFDIKDFKLTHTKPELPRPRNLPARMESEQTLAGRANTCLLRAVKRSLGFETFGELYKIFLRYAPEDAIADYAKGKVLENGFLDIIGNIYNILFIVWFRTGADSGCVIGANGNFNSTQIVHIDYEFAVAKGGRIFSYDMFPSMGFPLTTYSSSVWHYEPWRNHGNAGRFVAMPMKRDPMPASWHRNCGFIAHWANRKMDQLGLRAVASGQPTMTLQEIGAFYNRYCYFELRIDTPHEVEVLDWNGGNDDEYARKLQAALNLVDVPSDRPHVGDIRRDVEEAEAEAKRRKGNSRSKPAAEPRSRPVAEPRSRQPAAEPRSRQPAADAKRKPAAEPRSKPVAEPRSRQPAADAKRKPAAEPRSKPAAETKIRQSVADADTKRRNADARNRQADARSKTVAEPRSRPVRNEDRYVNPNNPYSEMLGNISRNLKKNGY